MKIDNSKWNLLRENLSIDLEKYRNKEILPAINSLVNTPYKVVLQFTIWPLFFILAISMSGIFLIWPQSWMGGVLWILTGLLVGPLSGITVAAFLVVKSLDESSRKLYEATLDTMSDISADIKLNADNIPMNLELPTYKELLRFLKLNLVIPALKELTLKKLWPLGNWIGNIVSNYLKKMSQKSEQLIENEQGDLKSEGPAQIKLYAEMIAQNSSLLKKNIDNAHKSATNLILSPLRFTMTMSLILNALFLFLVWYFFL
jgi:hypothetical protein